MSATFEAQHFSQTQSFELTLPAREAFGLFDPEGEKLWVPGWQPQILFPASASMQEGMIFTTQYANEAKTIWIVATYNPEDFIVTYWRVTPESRLAKVSVGCSALNQNVSRVSVTYEFTALSEAGNVYIEQFRQHYPEYIKSWQTEINLYLQQIAVS